MGKISAILQAAQQRARELNLPYEGALYPDETYEILQSAPGAKGAEIDGRWKQNPHFMTQLEQQVDKEALVIFICRSGIRSNAAAATATQAGYNDCYNVLEGFEGEKDADGHRNTLGGWRVSELPWEQS